jgi:phosphohistidine phosphatase
LKSLLILRHAKSSWKHEGLPDHERPLNRRGRDDAPRIGKLLAQQGLRPDHVVSSTAVRAQTTARLAGEACGYEGRIELREELYLSGAESYLAALRATPAAAARAMIVGHNPDVEELLTLLTRRDEAMPTAALAWVELPIDSWDELHEGVRGKLAGLWRARDIE